MTKAKSKQVLNKHVGLIVVPPGVFIEAHEKRTADFLAVKLGLDLTFLVADRTRGVKTPDVQMDGLLWEVKCPSGKSPRTIENNLRLALRQSPHIILDLRRMDGRVPTHKYLSNVEKLFNDFRTIKRIIVITRQEAVVDYAR